MLRSRLSKGSKSVAKALRFSSNVAADNWRIRISVRNIDFGAETSSVPRAAAKSLPSVSLTPPSAPPLGDDSLIVFSVSKLTMPRSVLRIASNSVRWLSGSKPLMAPSMPITSSFSFIFPCSIWSAISVLLSMVVPRRMDRAEFISVFTS